LGDGLYYNYIIKNLKKYYFKKDFQYKEDNDTIHL